MPLLIYGSLIIYGIITVFLDLNSILWFNEESLRAENLKEISSLKGDEGSQIQDLTNKESMVTENKQDLIKDNPNKDDLPKEDPNKQNNVVKKKKKSRKKSVRIWLLRRQISESKTQKVNFEF